jgi:hypothetical protein
MVPELRIIAADSAAAILDDKFTPLYHVAAAAVLVESPYREAQSCLAEPIFKEVENNFEVIVHEAELCQSLLEAVKADVVHLDTSLGGLSVEEISPVELSNMKVSINKRQYLLKILPKLRKIAGEIRRKHGIEMLAIGKESMPVRIAELTAGSEAVIYACAKAVEENQPLLLGLPTRCQHRIADGKVYLQSLMEAEHDVRGFAEDSKNILGKVSIMEMQNPVARGFRTLKIAPR